MQNLYCVFELTVMGVLVENFSYPFLVAHEVVTVKFDD